MSYRDKRITSQAFGTTPELIKVANLRIARGRYISEEDVRGRANVAVIGDQVAKQFFRLVDPLGKDFRIGDRPWGTPRPGGRKTLIDEVRIYRRALEPNWRTRRGKKGQK